MSKTFFPQEIFIHKGQVLAKNGQCCVQRSLYISRTVNGMKNLIDIRNLQKRSGRGVETGLWNDVSFSAQQQVFKPTRKDY